MAKEVIMRGLDKIITGSGKEIDLRYLSATSTIGNTQSNPVVALDQLNGRVSGATIGLSEKLWFSNGSSVMELFVFYLSVNNSVKPHVLIGGVKDGTDMILGLSNMLGTYPSIFPISADGGSTAFPQGGSANDNTVFNGPSSDFHISSQDMNKFAKSYSDVYLTGIDSQGFYGSALIQNDNWWDSLHATLQTSSSSGDSTTSTGNFNVGTYSKTSNIQLTDIGQPIKVHSVDVMAAGIWDICWFYSNPGNHSNADGMRMSGTTGAYNGKAGWLFLAV